MDGFVNRKLGMVTKSKRALISIHDGYILTSSCKDAADASSSFPLLLEFKAKISLSCPVRFVPFSVDADVDMLECLAEVSLPIVAVLASL